MIGVGWLPQNVSPAFDNVSTPVFDMAWVIVIPFHILESVWFPLPERQILWHPSHKHLYAIFGFEASDAKSGGFFLQDVIVVRLYPLLLDPALDIFVLFTPCKQVVGIVMSVHVKDTLSVAFPSLRHLIALRSTGPRVCFHPRQRR
jgi:hypothetical protein